MYSVVLMMAMAGLGANEPLSRELEFQLWREATSIYLISAPGGCDPVGMAVTAARRPVGSVPNVTVDSCHVLSATATQERSG